MKICDSAKCIIQPRAEYKLESLRMMQSLPRNCLICVAGWTFLVPQVVFGQSWNEASRHYGQGVSAYFAGRSGEAEAALSRAIEINVSDPRPYYFRALGRLRSGRVDEARNDLRVGAALEAAQPNRYAVGTALQRVQGSHRLMLEQFRRQASTWAAEAATQRGAERDQQITDRDPGALRQQVVIPLEELFRRGGPRPLSAEELARRAAASSRPTAVAREPAERPASVNASDDDPFRDDAPPPAVAIPAQRAPAAASTDPPETAPKADDTDEDPFDF